MVSGGSRQGRAYIGSFTTAGGSGILRAAVDPDTGALTVLDAVDGVENPSYLALDGDTLYAVSETADGAVAAFRVGGERPEAVGLPVPVDAVGPTHLAVFGGHIVTANYHSGSVSAVPLRPDGSLAEAVGAKVLAYKGSGPDKDSQEGPHAHHVLPDPSGRWFTAVDLGTDTVRVHTLVDGAPAVHRETALRPGSGPRHLAFHPDGERAYVLNELSPTVTVCRWDATEGLLTPVGETPVLPGSPDGDAYPSAVVVSPDGRFVWTATRGEDVISVLSVDGGLTLVATVPCGGAWPRDLALHPSGRFLYAANEHSGDVTWFAVDPETGVPRRNGSVPAPAASCVVFG